MYIKVRLLNGFSQYLWYKKPDHWHPASLLGTIVRVPLRTQHIPALVIGEQAHMPKTDFAIKEAESIEPMPHDPHHTPFITQLANYYQIKTLSLIKRIRQFVHQKNITSDDQPVFTPGTITAVALTDEQQKVVNFIAPHILTPSFQPIVMHGVTGSGKTEVYKSLIRTAITHHKNALLLLPEVTLALEFEKRLKTELPDIEIYSFHSGTTIKQKRLLWQRLLDEKPTLIIGVHLPVLLPIPQLGIIIIDEEHEVGYQEKKHPRINSKEAALMRAKVSDIPILLGSATPSMSTLYNAKHRGWHFFQLKNDLLVIYPL
jgi:Primosomal protein N'' (replication factor Y) - superfamily II helicase